MNPPRIDNRQADVALRALEAAYESLDCEGDQLLHLQTLLEIIDHLSDNVQYVSHLAIIGQAFAGHCRTLRVPVAELVDAARCSLNNNHDSELRGEE